MSARPADPAPVASTVSTESSMRMAAGVVSGIALRSAHDPENMAWTTSSPVLPQA